VTDVEVVGASTAARTMRAAADALADGVDGADDDAAQIVAGDARFRAPRRTGALASTVDARGPVVSAGSSTVTHAWPVHSGVPARNIPARPVMTDARNATEPRWVDAFRRHVVRILSRIRGA